MEGFSTLHPGWNAIKAGWTIPFDAVEACVRSSDRAVRISVISSTKAKIGMPIEGKFAIGRGVKMGGHRIVSINVSTGSYASFIERIATLGRQRISSYTCVANVHMVMEAHKDASFASIVNQADLVTPDGMPLAKAIRLLHGASQDRVAGMDLVPDIVTAAAENKLSIFIYGSTDHVLEAVTRRMVHEHPKVKIAGTFSPPFRQLTSEECSHEVSRINNSGAHIVLVALGCPKQERWMASNKGKINAVMVGIGGALPVYARLQSRAPRIMQELALEWLYRLCQEPRRLFRRYLVTNTTFLVLLAGCYVRKCMRRIS